MGDPRDSYPESATLGADEETGDGEAALRAAIAAHGEDLAAAVERIDELDDALATALLIAASADEEEVDHVTDSAANLVAAVDGLTTDEAAALATAVGEDADEVSAALEAVLDLQRDGHLEDLVGLARTLSALDVDEDAVRGLNGVLDAVGAAERESEPVGLLGAIGELRTADARAGLGYLVAVLKALGRRPGGK